MDVFNSDNLIPMLRFYLDMRVRPRQYQCDDCQYICLRKYGFAYDVWGDGIECKIPKDENEELPW